MTDPLIFRFMPLTLSMETLGGLATPIVRRGIPLPAKRNQQFTTTADDQKVVRIEIFLGERPIANQNIRIGHVELTGLPDAPRGGPQIDVLFDIDQTCTLTVTAKEKKTANTKTSQLRVPPEHLTPEQIKVLLKAANDYKDKDTAQVRAIEAKNEAYALVHRAEKYLQNQQRYSLGNATDQQIEEKLASLGLALQQDDIEPIKENTIHLGRLLPDASLGNLGTLFGSGGDIFGGLLGPPPSRTQNRQKQNASAKTGQKAAPPAPPEQEHEDVVESKKGIFSAGQHFDAKRVVRDLFAQSTTNIDIIDGYVGEDVLNLLTVKRETVHVRLLTGKVAPAFLTLARDFVRQYKGLEIRSSKTFHDRFIIIDNTQCYHFGASLEHLGNKTFMFSKIEEPVMQGALLKQWNETWATANPVL